tara:strand:- start:242 stop:2833 length:2592 start_codon:yes stop_codon:yes gene_type:complete
MTSSFGNLVGKERDELPNIANTNYVETEPDLTNSVNAQIDANIQDTRQFYDEMAKIQKLIAETPMKNLESLAQFSSSASEAMRVYRKKQEAQALVDESMVFLDTNALDQIRTAEGKFNLENAKFDNELLKENTEESINFLRTRNASLPEDITTRELLRRLNENYFGARQQFINENGGKDITDIDEYIKLHGAADELMITGMLMQAEELGVDINSRQFRKLFYQTVYPNIKQRRENNIQSWKLEANRNFEQNRTKKLDKIIVDTLQPYDANTNTAIDVVTLVDTIQNTMNFDTRKEATDYLFSRVANQVDSDQPQLNISHLNYLFNDALHKHDGNGGKLYKYADGPFGGKDANASLIQKLETKLALETDRNIRANTATAQQEINELNRQYNGQPPVGLLQKKLEELENRYPNIDVRSLELGAKSITNGGGYPNAGQGDPDIDFKAQLEGVFNIPKKDLSIAQQVEIQRAYGDFKAQVKNQTDNGIDPLKAQRLILPQVQQALIDGKYQDSAVEARLGKDVRSQDINADRDYIEKDFNKASNQGEFVSIHEKQALSELKRHYLYGEPFPSYFYGVTRGTNQSPYQYADDRFRAMGGYDGNNAIAERFETKDGVLVDPQFGLTKAELNELEAKPHLTKTYAKILEPEKTKQILEGFKTGNDVGTFDSAVGPKKRGADKLTVGELLVYADRGGSNFGLFGLSAQELKDSVRFLPPSFKNQVFNEETQSFLVLELIRQRANRTNSIRGAIIQAKKGGEATVFQGDEKEGSWDRLITLDDKERNALLDVFPQLRNIPMNQFQNLTQGVVLGLQTEINNYQRNREKLRQSRIKQRENKEQTFGYGLGQKEPTTIEELKQVPAVKKSREGR